MLRLEPAEVAFVGDDYAQDFRASRQAGLRAVVRVAGGGHGDVGPGVAQRALGHGHGDLLADCAAPVDVGLGQTEQLALGRVAVDDEATLEDAARPLHVGEQRGEHPTGAALGGGERHALVVGALEHRAEQVLDLGRQDRRERFGVGHASRVTQIGPIRRHLGRYGPRHGTGSAHRPARRR